MSLKKISTDTTPAKIKQIKATITPRDAIALLTKIGATVDNQALSAFFATKGVVVSANSLRAYKAAASRR